MPKFIVNVVCSTFTNAIRSLLENCWARMDLDQIFDSHTLFLSLAQSLNF